MNETLRNPRILIVTPEVTYLPKGMCESASNLSAKAGGLGDVSAALINALFEQGADVHVTLPNYRSIFRSKADPFIENGLKPTRRKIPHERIHLAEDRAFFYLPNIYNKYGEENVKIALAFQREVINNIIPQIKPDLIHCNDWMTGLLPAVARVLNIPCLFTIHNIYSVKCTMSHIEDRGIDAAAFWQHLFFDYMPPNYEEARNWDPVDFLTSGIFAAHFVNTVSPTFLLEVVKGRHAFVQEPIKNELGCKVQAGCAEGILNAPDPSYNASKDRALFSNYNPENHTRGKQENKQFLQQTLGLIQDVEAPLYFWPSRLDTVQKGCDLLAEIIYKIISSYWHQNLQIIFVADGEFKKHFRDIVHFHSFFDRVAICNFEENLARLAYGAADFVLLPSLFEPCGLPQMIGAIYGALPIAHDTGGIHDTIEHLNVEKNTGNGFLFETFDSNGLFWAINQAMLFYNLPKHVKEKQIKRIMNQSREIFTHSVTARQYIRLYEKMLKRPLINHCMDTQVIPSSPRQPIETQFSVNELDTGNEKEKVSIAMR